ncbi:MAG: hypothetical protein QGF46_08750, partial [Planctomycetota bacterium]|nr:hypothetical protein [Planctomycetota bacterium]
VAANSANDGFEKRGIEFQRLVRERYLSFSESCESPCLVVDCNSRGVAEIHEQVATWVMDR